MAIINPCFCRAKFLIYFFERLDVNKYQSVPHIKENIFLYLRQEGISQ